MGWKDYLIFWLWLWGGGYIFWSFEVIRPGMRLSLRGVFIVVGWPVIVPLTWCYHWFFPEWTGDTDEEG